MNYNSTMNITKFTLIIVGIIVLLLLGLYLSSVDTTYNNPDKFYSSYEVGTDGYLCDTTAYLHPDWSGDKVEDYVMMSQEDFNLKYNVPSEVTLYNRYIDNICKNKANNSVTMYYKGYNLQVSNDILDLYYKCLNNGQDLALKIIITNTSKVVALD